MSIDPEGLGHKYQVERRDDAAGKDTGCRYFVLDPRHDPLARSALAVYAAQTDRHQATGAPAIGVTLSTRVALAAVPVGTVVVSAEGTIATRFDTDHGVVFGDHRPFLWDVLTTPAVVLWTVS